MQRRANHILGRRMARAVLVSASCLAISLLALSDAYPASRRSKNVERSNVEVRIGVMTLFNPQTFAIVAPSGGAVVLRAERELIALESSSGLDAAEVRVSGTEIVISAGNRIVRASSLLAASRNGEPVAFVLKIPGKITRLYHGTLEIKSNSVNLVAIVTMKSEVAVASIVAAESDPDTPAEALKAQAIATRSYLASSRGRHLDYDFCDTTHCQFLRELPSPESNAALATAATHAMVLTYNSSPIPAMYTRRCAGRTRTPQQVGLSSNGYPYYSVACHFCLSHPDRWRTRLSHSDAAELRASNEHDRLAVNRRFGWDTIPSNDFVVRDDHDRVAISGVGRGHGIGLCQAGSKAMAQQGASYQQILKHYYPETVVTNFPSVTAAP